MGISYYFYFLLPITDALLIAACSMQLRVAKMWKDDPTMYRVHDYSWTDRLVTWSIVGICVGSFHILFLISWFLLRNKLRVEDTQLRKLKFSVCVLEIILIIIALTSILVPGAVQWPKTYRETDFCMYSSICFIIVNIILALTCR